MLVVDEVLAVGDRSFRAKSEQRMQELISGGTSVVVVSHAVPMLRKNCHRVLWLDRGRVKQLGPADEVLDGYEAAS